jgi:YD repeat-containing protein
MRGRGVEAPRSKRGTRAAAVLAVAGLFIAMAAPPAGADISYVYDELGRLVGVVDPLSDTAVYSYDSVGNLLGIARYASSTASIIDFQPKTGPVGAVVTLHGTGFSPTPGTNAVTFNGLAAPVTSATAISLVVSVPTGATTGTIAVTTSAGSATSGSPFTVTAAGSAPTITSFSPTVGVPGTTVSVSGTNFEPVPTSNKIRFYGVPPAKSFATAATTTSLDVPVPANTRSGPITVATPGGTAVSAADFFVPVGGYTAAQVAFTGRIVVGGASVDVPLPSPGKLGLVVFEGVAGQRLDLGTRIVSGFGSPMVSVYRPDGATLTTTGSGSARYLPPLPMSGVYVIALQTGSTLSHTVRLTLSEEVVTTTVVGGSPVNVSLPRAGQRARVGFQGTAGQRIDLGLTHTFGGVDTSFRAADETPLVIVELGSPGELHSPALPSTATYLLMIEPRSNTGSFTATLSEPVIGSISIGGASVPVSVTQPGQLARLTFSGTTSQTLRLGITSATRSGTVAIYRPNGSTHLIETSFVAPARALDVPVLPVTGTYEIVFNPPAEPASVTLTLSEWVTGTTVLNGPPASLNITLPGQAGYLSFPGTAGQRVSHVLSGTITSAWIGVHNPSVGIIQAGWLPGTTFLDAATLPVTGTYFFNVNPTTAETGSTTITSYEVIDATGNLTINGGTTSATTSVPGQNALLSFPATSGQAITVRVTGNTMGCPNVSIVPPGGGSIGGTSSCSASFNVTGSVVTTGTHTVKIDPQGTSTGSITVEVTIP